MYLVEMRNELGNNIRKLISPSSFRSSKWLHCGFFKKPNYWFQCKNYIFSIFFIDAVRLQPSSWAVNGLMTRACIELNMMQWRACNGIWCQDAHAAQRGVMTCVDEIYGAKTCLVFNRVSWHVRRAVFLSVQLMSGKTTDVINSRDSSRYQW